MYIPSAFREERLDVMHSLIRAHPLGTLVTADSAGLQANLLPFTLAASNGAGILRAHMARTNEQLAALRNGAEALIIFQGPQAYISPSWYVSAQEHGHVVPTWNYVVVQARGKACVIGDPDWLFSQIEQLTNAQESARPYPWSVSRAPARFIQEQLQAIAGIEIPIDQLEGKWKVSQNRSEADRRAVATALVEHGDAEMAELVRAALDRR